jgi:hypothetical protein
VPLPRTRGRKAGEGRAPNFLHVYQSPSCRLPTSSRVPRVFGGRLETHIREARNDSLFNRSVHACLTMKWSFMMRQHPRPFFSPCIPYTVTMSISSILRPHIIGWMVSCSFRGVSLRQVGVQCHLRHAGDVLQSTCRPTVRQRRKG